MRILHLESDKYSVEALELLKSQHELVCIHVHTQEELQNHLVNNAYEVVFVRLGVEINKSIIDSQSTLKYIVTPTTGLNHIDVEYAASRSIHVISLKGETTFLSTIKSTAEHTWALLLSLIRNIPSASADVLNGNWQRVPFMATELDEKVIGIIGYGRLGKIVAQYAHAFGMQVYAYDVSDQAFDQAPNYVQVMSLDQLLTESDVVSIHIPSTIDTNNFFGKEQFSKMKSSAVFINTSRGEVVDEEALLNVLQTGKIAGAATDVLSGDSSWESSIPIENKLLKYAQKHANLIITPHMGGYGKDSIERTRLFVTKKLLNHLQI